MAGGQWRQQPHSCCHHDQALAGAPLLLQVERVTRGAEVHGRKVTLLPHPLFTNSKTLAMVCVSTTISMGNGQNVCDPCTYSEN
jgi:hypothetical protein